MTATTCAREGMHASTCRCATGEEPVERDRAAERADRAREREDILAPTTRRRPVHPYTGPTDYHVIDVLRVVDGDTLDLRVDLGFHLHALERFRLVEVNTPERGAAGWAEATAYVRAWLEEAHAAGDELRVRTHKAGAFGRWLGDVYAVNDAGSERRLVDDLLEHGHAVPYVR